MSFGLKKALIIFLCFFVAHTASASIPDGLNWLTNHANPDGSYAIDTDISKAYQATAETLRSFQATGNTSEPGIPYLPRHKKAIKGSSLYLIVINCIYFIKNKHGHPSIID